jgi:hypothetical protein
MSLKLKKNSFALKLDHILKVSSKFTLVSVIWWDYQNELKQSRAINIW